MNNLYLNELKIDDLNKYIIEIQNDPEKVDNFLKSCVELFPKLVESKSEALLLEKTKYIIQEGSKPVDKINFEKSVEELEQSINKKIAESNKEIISDFFIITNVILFGRTDKIVASLIISNVVEFIKIYNELSRSKKLETNLLDIESFSDLSHKICKELSLYIKKGPKNYNIENDLRYMGAEKVFKLIDETRPEDVATSMKIRYAQSLVTSDNGAPILNALTCDVCAGNTEFNSNYIGSISNIKEYFQGKLFHKRGIIKRLIGPKRLGFIALMRMDKNFYYRIRDGLEVLFNLGLIPESIYKAFINGHESHNWFEYINEVYNWLFEDSIKLEKEFFETFTRGE